MSNTFFLLRPALVGVLATALAGTAWAQVQPPPARAYRGLFGGGPPRPGETQKTLSAALSALGGYDDNVLAADPGAGGTLPDPRYAGSGYTGVGVASLSLHIGGPRRTLDAAMSSSISAYSIAGAGTAQNYTGTLTAQTELGRRASASVGLSAGYRNYFAIGSFRGLTPTGEPAMVDSTSPDFGLVDRRSWDAGVRAGLSRSWGRAQTTSLDASARRARYLDQSIGSTDSWSTGLTHRVQAGRRTAISASYTYSDTTYARQVGATRPFSAQSVTVSFSYRRPFSPRKTWSLDAGAGGTLFDTPSDVLNLPTARWNATGHASLSVDLGRSWSARANYQRGWELREGFTTPFFTDTVTSSVGGYLGRRVDLVLVGGYATGSAGIVFKTPYRSRTGSVQVRYALTRTSAVVVNYLRYYYEFDSAALLPHGLPLENDRQALRAGVTFWLPLFGSFGSTGSAR